MSSLLSAEQVINAAERLTTARRSLQLIDDLGSAIPSESESAYAIADAHFEQLGWASVGWKVGCTSDEAMKILSSPGPFSGRVLDGTVYGSGVLDERGIENPAIESEFAFILGDDLPAVDGHRYTREEVQGATECVTPAFEVVAPRFTDFTGVGYLSLIADSGANSGVALGQPTLTADLPDLSEVTVELDIDGTVVKTGVGSAILGDPWEALVWLANHLSDRSIGLRAGELVMSGTCTGIDPLPPGSLATGRYSGLGEVTLRRTSSS